MTNKSLKETPLHPRKKK